MSFIKQYKSFAMIVASVLMLTILLSTGSSTHVTAHGQGMNIRLQAAEFNPSLGEQPNIPPGLTIAGYAANQRGYYIVQFDGAVEQAGKDSITAAGAEILGYIPNNAFKVRMNPGQANRISKLGSVAWVGLFQPAYKLNPDLAAEGLFTVRVEQGANAGLAAGAIAQSGAEILARQGHILLIAADTAQLAAVAHVTDVAWVQNFQMREKHNEAGAGVIMGANTANSNGYDGSTQIVAVADTGIGGGTASTAHADIPSNRVTAVYDWPGISASGCYTAISDGSIDVDSGHGTHVAVSVLGDGDANGVGQGTAPAASLVFQSTEDFADMSGQCSLFYPDGYYLIGLPDDIRTLFQQAYDAGARIHSNSWGSDAAGDYTLDSANTDDFIWTNPDMTITFSAGNAGTDANGNGVVDNDSIGSPATAKNVITVGASENARPDNFACDTGLTYTDCAAQGGVNDIFTYGAAWPGDYPANPIASDPSAGNAQQMAAFSSRGPTDDGRIKPDVVAPGTWILSGYSDLYQQEYDGSANPQNGAWQYDGYGFPYSQGYKYMSGTSMSNPLTAGAAAVVRDYYQKAHGLNASAALVKATLINSAVDLLDENNDGANDNDYPIPNNHEGWGLVQVDNATDGSHQFVENAGISTGNTASYNYGVNSGGFFKVSLVWSDYPSTEAASANLVNNLNLKVTAPGGQVYWGNNFSGGWSTTGGSADSVNNVENVYVQSAASGTWTVEVIGANVPQGPQPFAIVVDGQFGAVDNPPTVSVTNPTDGATVAGTVAVTANASDDHGVAQVEFFVDGASIGVDSDGSDGWSASWDTTTYAEGSHTVSATATDSAAQTANDSVSVTVDNVPDPDNPPTVSITSPSNGATVSGSVSVTANATDDNGVSQVEFFVDGGSIGVDSDGSDGWSASWDTTAYADGGHTVSATATDSAAQTASDSVNVTVDNSAPAISLSASTYKVKGTQHADLSWGGATSTNVDVYRNGNLVVTTANDGFYTDNTGQKGGGSASYQVCEAGTSTCSNVVNVNW